MKTIAVSQRVAVDSKTGERRDALDQQWAVFLDKAGLSPLMMPNNLDVSAKLTAEFPISGVLLTGGNNLAKYNGDAPERDAVDRSLLDFAIQRRIPILGVCRGMQVIQDYFGQELERVSGHVVAKQTIKILEVNEIVNSYHEFGTTKTKEPLKIWARSEDGVVKGVYHSVNPIYGLMWHPERLAPHSSRDLRIFERIFKQNEGNNPNGWTGF